MSPVTQADYLQEVGYTKPDGTTDTMKVYVDPDGNRLGYERGGPLVIDQFEARLAAAHLAADQDEVNDTQAEYEKAREKAVRRLHERAEKARKDQA
jgi:hypothetical protein